ncbi:interaptin [Lampris incognitus]|uniref:interaptin n=1 Tax=Lampris incognitus TaxID=2546036 RepID=UPI0024B60186|nr:interaptin [Lampris incognitus]
MRDPDLLPRYGRCSGGGSGRTNDEGYSTVLQTLVRRPTVPWMNTDRFPGERELVQKRTFTRWINLHLGKCDPPMEVHDLFQDIQDGRILMALLEELSGCKLLHGFKKSSHRIFRLNNIAKVLSFLEERNVKLVSIDASDVADGNSSIILGLIWNIILFFQIKELTGNIKSQFPSCSSLSSIPTSSDSDTSHSSTPSEERRLPSVPARDHGKAIKKLLQWVQKRTRKYGVAVHDFGKSWTSGLAFLAVIKSIDTSLVDMRRALLRSSRENVEEAFRTAHYSLGIPRLLEPEDVTINPPDEQSIMTYVAQFLEHFPDTEEPEEPRVVIERSISMGRLSSCDSDSDHIRNGVLYGHLRERPHMVHKNWVKPPPKILISSLSVDRGVFSPTSPTAGARSWASEDSLEKSPPEEDVSTSMGGDVQGPRRQIFTTPAPNSPLSSYVHSPICSSVSESVNSESVNSESVISDSAIGSPDSWMEGDVRMTPERFGGSRSDSSLCDSGTAWDVSGPLTTPEEVTAIDEGLSPLSVGIPLDEQSIPKMFIDEGIYSMSSMESTQERIQVQSDKEEEDNKAEEAKSYIQDVDQDMVCEHASNQKEVEDKADGDSEQMDTSQPQRDHVCAEQLSSLGPSDERNLNFSEDDHSLESEGTNQSQSNSNHIPLTSDLFEELEEKNDVQMSSQRESECAREAAELNGESKDHEGQLNVKSRSVSGRNGVETACEGQESLSEGKVEKKGISKEKHSEAKEYSERQEEANKRVLNGLADPQKHTGTKSYDFAANTHSEQHEAVDQSLTNQDGSSKPSRDHSTNHNCSRVSVTSDQTEEAKDRAFSPKRENQDGDKDLDRTGTSGNQEIDTDVNNETLNEKSCTSIAEDGDKATESALLGGLLEEKFKPIPTEQTREVAYQDSVDVNQHDTVRLSETDSAGSEATNNAEITTTPQPYGCLQDDQNNDVRTTTEINKLDTPPPLRAIDTKGHPVDSDLRDTERDATDQLDCHHVKTGTLLSVEEAAIAQLNRSNPDDSWSNCETGSMSYSRFSDPSDMDLFHTDADRSSPLEELVSERLEPMDMFYPDKEELMYTEPPEEDVESQWSVFSVSALQPAPASEPLPETHTPQQTHGNSLTETHPPDELDKELKCTVHLATQEQEVAELRQEGETPSEAQEQPRCVGEMMGEDGGHTASEGANLCDLGGTRAGSPSSARENTKPLRSEAESSRTPHDSLIPTDLRHRLLANSNEALDNRPNVSTVETHDNNSDPGRRQSSLPVTDLYMLLLLWMLLYCLWVLPQIDLRTLPGLLLNLDH